MKRRNALLTVALLVAVGVGAVSAVALGLGGDDNPPAPTPTPTVTAKPSATPVTDNLEVVDELTVGKRPNVIRSEGDSVFVGSFREDHMRILDAKTGKLERYEPKVGIGVNDGAFGFGSLWLAVSRAKQVVRLDAKSGKPQQKLSVPYAPSAIATSKDAVWVALVPGNAAPDLLLKLDPKTGETLSTTSYPYGIMSLSASPTALWVAARRRARVQRVSLQSGEVLKTIRVGDNRSEDIVYDRGTLWAATPRDNNVYKIKTGTGETIPISVGQQPRQLAIGDGVVYVTNYSSSNLYTIDVKSSTVVGDPLGLPVNPFSLALDDTGALWVGSQPENKLSKVATDHAG